MKTKLIAACAVAMALSTPAFAWEGRVVACYDKVWVPAQYKTSKHLHSKSHTEWEHRGNQIAEVYYPPMYMEKKHLVMEGHYVKRKAPCRN